MTRDPISYALGPGIVQTIFGNDHDDIYGTDDVSLFVSRSSRGVPWTTVLWLEAKAEGLPTIIVSIDLTPVQGTRLVDKIANTLPVRGIKCNGCGHLFQWHPRASSCTRCSCIVWSQPPS